VRPVLTSCARASATRARTPPRAQSPEILRLPSTDSVLRGLVRVEDITPIDEKVDIWSFGVTVYELVTGVIVATV
jgi:serine/threonine protein kinase